MPTNGIRLFRIFGITVFLHWSWLVFAAYEIQSRKGEYSSLSWNIAEYLALFLIVLLHEFGHSLACRSVGGKAERIVLWPLGGVAYVQPPPRAGAVLWSLVAGPLVNVILLPLTLPFVLPHNGYFGDISFLGGNYDLQRFLYAVGTINLVLLLFNLLPIFPLDGGQILRALLWFVIGPVRSLMIATVIGMIGAASLGLYALYRGSSWIGVLAALAAYYSYKGFKQAQMLRRMAAMPRRPGLACPSCGMPPQAGPLWICRHCHNPFDAFENRIACPACGRQHQQTMCLDCGARAPSAAWDVVPPPPPQSPPASAPPQPVSAGPMLR